ncbi:MAG: MBL fold metallo-hydrolase [Nitrospirota bacterium]
MRLVFLGCGTSTGVPMIGCKCNVCLSSAAKNIRTRSSLLIHYGSRNILIDTSIDFRMQALTHEIERIDSVLFTHAHSDHIYGIDDLRSFNKLQNSVIPCYGNKDTIKRIREVFCYIFDNNYCEGWRPQIETVVISNQFNLFGLDFQPVEVRHGRAHILGYRFNDAAYITDCSGISEESKEMLKDLKLLILGALAFNAHPKHFSLDQAIEIIQELKPEFSILTHLSHAFDYAETNKILQESIELAYDGMVVEI